MSDEAIAVSEVELNKRLKERMEDIGEAVWNAHRLTNGLIGSQKAAALAVYMSDELSYYTHYGAPRTLFILNDDDPEEVVEWVHGHINSNKDIFTRTCPLNPRHGVLESTRCDQSREAIIETVEALQAVMREHDPKGCLMVQPFVECVGSAVLAPNMYVVMGEGHDGITAGHGFSLQLPLRDGGWKGHFNNILKRMSDETGREYDPTLHEVEFVFNHGSTEVISDYDGNIVNHCDITLTQIRGCDEHIQVGAPPAGVSINGAVPSGTVVASEVWVMSGLEEVIWLEENITKEKVPEGFVVSEPNGSLLSHICAHCRTHGIPYIIGEVSEGETWTEAASGWVVENSDGLFEAQPYNPFDYIESFQSGIVYGNTHWRRKQAYFSTFFHQWLGQPMNDPEFTAFLAGIFAAWMVKAAVAACVGEIRHARGQKRNRLPDCGLFMSSIIGDEFLIKYNSNLSPNLSERGYYHDWIKETVVDWSDASKALKVCEKIFNTGWASSYGGKKWGSGAASAAKVAGLIAQLCDTEIHGDPSSDWETLGPELISAVNELENAQHNNGNLLNKFGNEIKEVYTCGTMGFDEQQLQYAFLTYSMAKDVLEDKLTATTKGPQNDWGVISDWFLSKTPKFWRTNPVFSTTWSETDMPEGIIAAVETHRSSWNNWGNYWSHSNQGHAYSEIGDDSFVPCNHSHCSTCISHAKMIDSPLVMEALGSPAEQGMDVWEMQDGDNTTAVLKPRIINTLREMVASGESVTIEQVVDAYAKAVETDCVDTAEKHLGQILYGFSSKDFVLIMNAIKQVKEAQV